MKPTCIAIDFDGTLAYFKGGYEQLFDIFVRQGATLEQVREGYQTTKKASGFSIAAMVDTLSRLIGHSLDQGVIEQEFTRWLARSLFLFDDSLHWVIRQMEMHIPLAIVTAGNRDYQAQKINLTHLPYHHLFVVAGENEKPVVIRQLLSFYGPHLLLIDDRPSALDLMRDEGLTEEEVVIVRLLRKESPYYHDETAYSHHVFATLVDVQRWLDVVPTPS